MKISGKRFFFKIKVVEAFNLHLDIQVRNFPLPCTGQLLNVFNSSFFSKHTRSRSPNAKSRQAEIPSTSNTVRSIAITFGFQDFEIVFQTLEKSMSLWFSKIKNPYSIRRGNYFRLKKWYAQICIGCLFSSSPRRRNLGRLKLQTQRSIHLQAQPQR